MDLQLHLLRRHRLRLALGLGRRRPLGGRRALGSGRRLRLRGWLPRQAARKERGHRLRAHPLHLQRRRILEQLLEAVELQLARVGQRCALRAHSAVDHKDRHKRRKGAQQDRARLLGARPSRARQLAKVHPGHHALLRARRRRGCRGCGRSVGCRSSSRRVSQPTQWRRLWSARLLGRARSTAQARVASLARRALLGTGRLCKQGIG